MDQEKLQQDLASYIGKLLRESFGRGPGSIFVSIDNFIITVYLKNFLSPTEHILMSQKQSVLVEQTREELMTAALIPEIKAYIKVIAGMDVEEFYFDWGMHNKSGLFVCICSNQTDQQGILDQEYPRKSDIHDEIRKISNEAQKEPEELFSYLLTPRTLIVIRNGILVRIEEELIRMGFSEQLRIAKRNLEKTLLHNARRFEEILNTKVIDSFVDWDFNLDKSVIVFILKPNQQNKVEVS